MRKLGGGGGVVIASVLRISGPPRSPWFYVRLGYPWVTLLGGGGEVRPPNPPDSPDNRAPPHQWSKSWSQ